MAVSIESNPESDLSELMRLERWLPSLLSVIAGMVDVIGFLTLGVFTAHITGNLVVIAALLVRGGPPNLSQVLAVPFFALAVAALWLIAKAVERRGPAVARPLLVIQFLLLTCVLILSIIYSPAANRQSWTSVVIAMIAVSSMAGQSALLRLALPGAPSTIVMTSNLTNATLSLLDTLSPSRPLTEDADEHLKKTSKVVVGFFVGCIAGALAVSFLGEWSWLPPVVLAGVACVYGNQIPSISPELPAPVTAAWVVMESGRRVSMGTEVGGESSKLVAGLK
jgi:uncharacterized membrane protein YoaK (UPF0700 family)